MIHGGRASIGCLAMGDPAAEDLFVLAALTGLENLRVVLSPVDLRWRSVPVAKQGASQWLPELYGEIRNALAELPAESGRIHVTIKLLSNEFRSANLLS